MVDSPEKKVSFKDTLNLPQTTFPIRSNPKEDDPAMIKRWEDEDLYSKSFEAHQGNKKFILHDGPPYANGNIHLGHAYNKIVKDIATKSHRMMGMHVPVVPGWDCHGLPIEIKVTAEQPNLSRPLLIKACRDYAKHWINVQREEFKALGILMHWQRPYLTMDFSYEAKELNALGVFVAKGYIERSNKTVPWCFSCQTVLASAEIEYADRKDPSIYVLFPIVAHDVAKAFPALAGKAVSVVVWTTTPWTLPLNKAVLVKPQTSYVVLAIDDALVCVGKDLADDLCAKKGVAKVVVAEVQSDAFIGVSVHNPLVEKVTVPILLDGMVLTNEGTAFVHCAPGAGPQDYETGIKNGLAISSPVSSDGTYDDTVIVPELKGMVVTDAQIWVIKKLAELNKLFFKNSITHSYPHCWRCRKGLIFRATKQWFFNLAQDDLRERVIEASSTIATLPEKSINQLQATIEGRLEWCISRQRAWGVPIPALICTSCDHTYITQEFIDTVAQGVALEGVEYWNNVAITDLVPAHFACSACKGTSFTKEQDILDVWFDSGLSHFTVLFDNETLSYPADLYLEGKDQHRGWFQSSLLTSMALEGVPAMKTIITHGFAVDDKGHKMSKSLGNVVAPQQIIEKMGTDGLRLWASSIDFSSEAVVSENLLNNVQEVFRKVRNTCRFLLSNLYDFDHEKDAISFEHMRMVDQRALQELALLNSDVIKAYEQYDFTAVFHQLSDYASVNLSTFYFEIVKDTLYVEKADGHARRSVQTACWHILDTMTRLMAPVFSFTAEQVSDIYQKNKSESIHLQKFATTALMYDALQERRWDMLKAMRSAILKSTEGLRATGEVKRSLDTRITCYVDPSADCIADYKAFVTELERKGELLASFFQELSIVSQWELASSADGLQETNVPGFYVKAQKAWGEKCPRCWQWSVTGHEHGLCDRCFNAIK